MESRAGVPRDTPARRQPGASPGCCDHPVAADRAFDPERDELARGDGPPGVVSCGVGVDVDQEGLCEGLVGVELGEVVDEGEVVGVPDGEVDELDGGSVGVGFGVPVVGCGTGVVDEGVGSAEGPGADEVTGGTTGAGAPPDRRVSAAPLSPCDCCASAR